MKDEEIHEEENEDPLAWVEDMYHPEECDCAICYYGYDAWLFQFHPSEY